MLKHNLKLVLRHLWNKRIYSFVILLSLTAGFVCSNILIAFLAYETNTDSFHKGAESVFQIHSDDPFQGKGQISFIPKPFADYIIASYPEVEDICQLNTLAGASIEVDKNMFHDWMILSADKSFFSLFDFPFIHGQRNNCLDPGKIVLSREKATVLFGRDNVLSEVVILHTQDTMLEMTISAVIDRPLENTHLTFDALVNPAMLDGKWYGGVTYVSIDKGTAAQQFQDKINADDKRPGLLGRGKTAYTFSPIEESYFNTDNKMPFTKTRSPMFINVVYVVCGLILFIACFNFINLFLLFGQNRKKEVGIKKTLGVTPRGLLGFCVIEAGVYVLISALLAAVVTGILLPSFNTVFESNVPPAYFANTGVIGTIAFVIVMSGVVVVVISLLKQWHMRPISLMNKRADKVQSSRVLFTFQFIISVTLAICAITVVKQIDHIEHASLGFNRHLVQLNAPGRQYSERLPALKHKIAQLPDVKNVTISGGNPISGNAVMRVELDGGQTYSPYLFSGDEDFFRTLNFELIEGHFPTQEGDEKVVNQRLARQFNLTPGDEIPGNNGVVKGIIKDFTVGSFKEEIPPVIVSYYERGRALLIDYGGSDFSGLIPRIQTEWQALFPDNFFDYQILQMELMKKHKEDLFVSRIVIAFSIISIVLSCFGLFALSWAVIQGRTKEIGIRKVLGATSVDILNLLTVSFTRRIAMAFILAAPIGYYLMTEWLNRFVNRIDLNISIFAIAGFLMIIVSAITLSIQTVKAMMTSPVDEIRNE